MKSNLIGFVIAILAIPLFALGAPEVIVLPILFGGIILFASLKASVPYFDYIIANKNEAMIRKRMYINFLPFTFVSMLLTLGKSTLKIPVFEKYYVVKAQDIESLTLVTNAFITDNEEALASQENYEIVKISFKEYFRLWREQTKICKSGQLSKEFINACYGENSKDVKKAKTKLILAIVFTFLSLCMITPGDMFSVGLALIYGAVFIPMVILWIPDLIKEKAIQTAYEKANKIK